MAIKEKGSLSTTVVVSRSPDLSGNYVCDGTADDIEINEALAYVNTLGGGRVTLKQGTYTLADPIVFLGNNIWLRGMGRSTIINGNGLADGENAINLVARTGCAIKKLAIEISTAVGTRHCIFADNGCNNLSIYDVTIIDSDSDGIHIEGTNVADIHIRGLRINDADDYGIYVNMDAANYCQRLQVDGFIIVGAGNVGMYLRDCQYAEVSNGIIYNSTGHNMQLHTCSYCDVSNCIFSGSSGGSGVCMDGCTHCALEGNQCVANLDHGIYLTTATECSLADNLCTLNDSDGDADADGVYVDTTSHRNNVIGNHCCQNHRYGIHIVGTANNITDNYIYQNDREGIYVAGAECTVNGNHVIDNSVDGAGLYCGIYLTVSADKCQINGNWIGDIDGSHQSDCIYLADGATQCQIVGNYCYNAKYVADTLTGSGITLAANNIDCLVEGNYVYLCDGYGIQVLAGCVRTSVDGNQVNENGLDGIIIGSADCSIQDNWCRQNGTTSAGTYHGIYLDGNADRCAVNGNHIWTDSGDTQYTEDGIHLADGAVEVQINGNYCYDLLGDGIMLAGNNLDCQIVGNTCSACDDNGIYILDESDRCVVTGNKCKSNTLNGIFISQSDYCTITGNVCDTNGADGINVTGDGTHNADYNTLTGNTCTGNTDDGIAVEGGANANKNIVLGNQLLDNAGTALVDNSTNLEIGHNITV